MSMNTATASERVHIAFFGRRNAGKSSLVNAVTGQKVSVVSEVKGTTTDPVKKAMELLPLGPVEIIDTPGFDDEGTLGELRVARTKEVLRKTDAAVLAVDGTVGFTEADQEMETILKEQKVPYVIAVTKGDQSPQQEFPMPVLMTSAHTGAGINELKETLARIGKKENARILLKDLLEPGDIVVLVMPQDEAAPKGRLILPQQMMVREVLDAHAMPIACQTQELQETLSILNRRPKLVITDSQAFREVAPVVPEDVLLTSFSILFARYKGELNQLMSGVRKLAELQRLHKDAGAAVQVPADASVQDNTASELRNPRILISEGCTHHRQCGDIGTVKLPKLVRSYTGADPEFAFTSGGEFPEDLAQYDLVIHCGACMLNEKEMHSRLRIVAEAGVPIVNYGIAIAYMRGILKRSLQLFPEVLEQIED